MSVIKPARKEISLCFSPPADGAGRQPTVTEELVRRERPISEEYLYYLARACVVSCVQLLQRHGLSPSRLLCPWDYPGKNSAVGCHFLLQGIFPIQGSNLCLLHLLRWQADTLPLRHVGSPVLFGTWRVIV